MSLRSLSDPEFLSRLQQVVAREHESTLDVLLYLNEMQRRKLHLLAGYSSLFDYATSALKYSASAAIRRIRSARCVARYPLAGELLRKQEINLSTLSLASRVLNDKNQAAVLERIRNRSQREVQAIVAEYQPRMAFPDKVRVIAVPVSVSVSPPGAAAVSSFVGDKGEPGCSASSSTRTGVDTSNHCETSNYNRSGCNQAAATVTTLEQRVVLQFSARPEFVRKLERMKSVAWHRLGPDASLEEVFELALDVFLERRDPEQRSARREAPSSPAEPVAQGSRHVPAAVRDKVFQRDRNRCAYVGTTGKRCNSRIALQIDHIKPLALGGLSRASNLRVLCAYHNRLEAERLLGPGASATRRKSDVRPMHE